MHKPVHHDHHQDVALLRLYPTTGPWLLDARAICYLDHVPHVGFPTVFNIGSGSKASLALTDLTRVCSPAMRGSKEILAGASGFEPELTRLELVVLAVTLYPHETWWNTRESHPPGYLLAKEIRVPSPCPNELGGSGRIRTYSPKEERFYRPS